MKIKECPLMADTQTLIRRYEYLLQKQATTLDEVMEVEKSWITLHEEMKREMKHLSQRNRKLLKPFVKKTLEESKNISNNLFQQILRKNASAFIPLMREHPKIYLDKGVKGLINIHLRQEKSPKTFHYYAEEIRRNEKLEVISEIEILSQIDNVLESTYLSIDEARKIEKRIVHIYTWWKHHKEHVKKTKRERYLMKQLAHYHRQLAGFIVKELNEGFDIEELVTTHQYVRKMQLLGIEELLIIVKEKQHQLASVVKSLSKTAVVNHPRDEFAHVRSMQREFVILLGDANTGKTGKAIGALKESTNGVYTGPIRDLASEVFEKVKRAGIPCELLTDETSIREPDAKHLSTIPETCPLNRRYDVAVIDEIQYLADDIRGSEWLRLLYGLKAKKIFLCGAPHSLPLLLQIIEECGDNYTVETFERKTPLLFEDKPYQFPNSVQRGDALIVFSRTRAMELAEQLKEEGISASIVHESLPYYVRKAQLNEFTRGLTEVLIATNAIGIGVNLPIRRVVFMETQMNEQNGYRPLTVQEVKQISGRAGRYGMFEKGYVNALDNEDEVRNKLILKEKPISKSYVTPSLNIARQNTGTLRQRLLAWKEMAYEDTVAQKANVEDKLKLLKRVEKWESKLGGLLLYQALQVDFTTSLKDVIELWVNFVGQLAEKKTSLTRPASPKGHSEKLEIYYAQLMLYINFSKMFKLPYDKAWVFQEKQQTAFAIQKGLKDKRFQYKASS
ncbi:hypothetical protein CN918_30110 [Priestia megaterium]|nr:hypothetical protein CN918_30110 [Priestia megaterium]